MNTPTTEDMVRAFEGTQGRATKEPLRRSLSFFPKPRSLEEAVGDESAEPFSPPHFFCVRKAPGSPGARNRSGERWESR